MSFGYGVGDVIAVFGHFERISIELRNYKDIPVQFQQLRAEIDLLRGTLKRVLSLEPECDAERETLEQIRAIVIYCAQPLQSMADKMRTKETSLGHFKTTRSLSSIGTRLHWSMVGLSDVEELRKTVMSQMAAINVLLNDQHQTFCIAVPRSRGYSVTDDRETRKYYGRPRIQHLEYYIQNPNCNRFFGANEINQNLTSIEQSMRHMKLKTERGTAVVRRQAAFITRHAELLFNLMEDMKKLFVLRMLLDIRVQLNHIISAIIEAIPLHLTLDIVRLDDVHGESWALPLQACRTWESFREILQFVVYVNESPGAKYITHNLFAVAQAKTGKEVDQEIWETMIKPGFHLEQGVVLKVDHWSSRCLDPKCTGTLLNQALEFETRQVW
ncbi:hypothetical protein LZL87_006623 [Fusarium oxysporum]|nr:hypothetical protein LZL87_006623 [Fusarium oxysporum]